MNPPFALIAASAANSGISISSISAPAACNRRRALANAAATWLSTPSSTSVVGNANRKPRREYGVSSGTGSPARIASSVAQQATLFAIGPIESSCVDSGNTPCNETRRAVGLKPISPHSAAGIRTEPPVSEPMAATAMASLTETAAPDEEPPGMRPLARSQGLRGVP